MATDRITVDGARVGYYREVSVRDEDSGWRFFAGDEDQAYMGDLERHGVHDLNTIVNYDPDILPLLDAKEGSRFEQGPDGKFRRLAENE
jgi:hypothetical protein